MLMTTTETEFTTDSVASYSKQDDGPLSRNLSMESSQSSSSNKRRKEYTKNRSTSSTIKPPDGGYGWVIVFASFMINLIADGVAMSFGLIFVELNNYFDEGKSKTAWVGSLFLSMPLMTGPVASALTDRYGCRMMTIVSGFLSAFGFILGYFSYRLEHLFFAFSISGAGLALCQVTSIVIVAYYFEKKRSLATGLAVCGTGMGTFVFAPLSQYFLDKYHWRGTLLIMAGFFLNIVIFGALMRDIDDYADCISEGSSDGSVCDSPSDMSDAESASPNPCPSKHRSLLVDSTNHSSRDSPIFNSNGPPLSKSSSKMFSSLVHIPTYISDHRDSNSICGEVISELSSRQGGYLRQLMQRYPNLINLFITKEEKPEYNSKYMSGTSKLNENVSPLSIIPKITITRAPCKKVRRSSRMNSLLPYEPGAYYRNLKLQRGSLTYRGAMLNIKRYRLRASSAPDIYRNSMVSIHETENSTLFEDFKSALKDLIDFSMFKSFQYTLFCFSNLLLYACIDVPYVYLPDLAIVTGASSKDSSSYLISVIGMINTLGIVFVGYIGDKTWIDPSFLYSLFISFSGISMGLIPLFRTYTGLATSAAIYGFTISANYALTSVILVDLISLDKFTNGYGFLLLVQGIASLIGPPMLGLLFDISGNYDSTFYVTGFCIFISGAIVTPIAKFGICSNPEGSIMLEPSSPPSSPKGKLSVVEDENAKNFKKEGKNYPLSSLTPLCSDILVTKSKVDNAIPEELGHY